MLRRLIPPCLVVVLALAAVPAAVSQASATRSCSLSGQERRLGPTYVTSLRVSGVSCASGKRLVNSYYRCRVNHGGKDGRCAARVRRYRCTEHRFNVIPTQYDARVTCRKGATRVTHRYTQFT